MPVSITTQAPTSATKVSVTQFGVPVVTDLTNIVNNLPRIITPITSTTSNGTATSGTTETRDAVLGDYQFTALSSRLYIVCLLGLVGNGTSGGQYMIRIRDGGASTAIVSSPIVAEGSVHPAASGTAGRVFMHILSIPQSLSAGTHTLSVWVKDVTGAGAFTPLAVAGDTGGGSTPRSLFVAEFGVA